MPWEHIDLDVTDAIATVTLNRPDSLNAFASTMRDDLLTAIQEASNCSRVLILAGAGKAFCSGGDVRAMENLQEEDLRTFIQQGKRVVACVRSLPIPSVASMHGVAAGAGFSLALACDLKDRVSDRAPRGYLYPHRPPSRLGRNVLPHQAYGPGNSPRPRPQREARRFRRGASPWSRQLGGKVHPRESAGAP